MNNREKEKYLYIIYKYTRDFDFRKLDKYKEANDDLCISDLILDYTMLYEFYKERTKKLQKENRQLRKRLKEAIEHIMEDQERTDIDEVINTTELLSILKGSEE